MPRRHKTCVGAASRDRREGLGLCGLARVGSRDRRLGWGYRGPVRGIGARGWGYAGWRGLVRGIAAWVGVIGCRLGGSPRGFEMVELIASIPSSISPSPTPLRLRPAGRLTRKRISQARILAKAMFPGEHYCDGGKMPNQRPHQWSEPISDAARVQGISRCSVTLMNNRRNSQGGCMHTRNCMCTCWGRPGCQLNSCTFTAPPESFQAVRHDILHSAGLSKTKFGNRLHPPRQGRPGNEGSEASLMSADRRSDGILR